MCVLWGCLGQWQPWEPLFDLLHFDKKEAAPHPGDRAPAPRPWSHPLVPYFLQLLEFLGVDASSIPLGPRAFRAKFWSHLCASDTRSLGALSQFGNQASKARVAAFTRDLAWKELSLFVPIIGFVFKGTAAAGRK